MGELAWLSRHVVEETQERGAFVRGLPNKYTSSCC